MKIMHACMTRDPKCEEYVILTLYGGGGLGVFRRELKIVDSLPFTSVVRGGFPRTWQRRTTGLRQVDSKLNTSYILLVLCIFSAALRPVLVSQTFQAKSLLYTTYFHFTIHIIILFSSTE